MTTDTLYPWAVSAVMHGADVRLTQADIDHRADRLAEELFALAADLNTSHLTLDLARVTRLTPATVGQLGLLRRWLRQLHGSLTLAHMPAGHDERLRPRTG